MQDAHALAQETIKAAHTVYAGAHQTPLQPADWLSRACEAHVLLKLENKQVKPQGSAASCAMMSGHNSVRCLAG